MRPLLQRVALSFFVPSLSVIAIAATFPRCAPAAVLVVDPQTGPYTTIQQALDAAQPADTIEVHPGIYDEELSPRVTCTLRSSEGRTTTILDGGRTHRLMASDSLDITLEGLTFRNGHVVTPGGGAILFGHGQLTIRQCDFRDNFVDRGLMGRNYGGAIYAYGLNFQVEVDDCLFKGNGFDSTYGVDCAGAIGLTQYAPGEPGEALRAPGSPRAPMEIVSSATFYRSTFIANSAPWGAAIYGSGGIGCDIARCLFVDLARSRTDFLALWEEPTGSCNIAWPYSSPFHQGTWYEKTEDVIGSIADPRLCPGDPEKIHESSPANDPGCGMIGNLPVGCAGPMVLAARPMNLLPRVDQLLLVYGYGLDQASAMALVGPSGQHLLGTDLTVNGTDLSARFDLRAQEAGNWALVVSTPGGDATMDSLVVSPVAVRGLLNGWIAQASVVDGTLFGADLVPGMTLTLRHQPDEASYPVEILQMIGTDSLRIRTDLRAAADGVYDLDVVLPSGSSYRVPAIAYVGTPPQVKVPEDYPTIGEALAAAPPCAEIQVGPGTYYESLTVASPVRLVGLGGDNSVTIRPSAGSRGIHVLSSAGPLTELRGLTVSHASVAGAPGGGIFCEAPARIEDCYIRENTVTGSGGRGAGIYATVGCRIIGNRIYANWAVRDVPGAEEDPWSEDPTLGGIGGGLYCKSCMVAGNTFESNFARDSGAFVMEGILRGNHLLWNGNNIGGLPYSAAARGEITWNYFDNECGAGEPYMLIEGPAMVAYNTGNDIVWDMCSYPAIFYLRGSIDFIHNTLWGVSVEACLTTDDDGETPPGHFRMRDNIFSSNGIRLVAGTGWDGCRFNNTESPRTPIPPDSVDVVCNLLDSSEISLLGSPCPTCGFQGEPMFCELPHWEWNDDPGYWYPVGDFDLHINAASEALPQNRDTPACVDTLGALGIACGVSPVLIENATIGWTPDGIRLTWLVPVDLGVTGFDIDREVEGVVSRANSTELEPCRSCEFIDRTPPAADEIGYVLIVNEIGGRQERVPLGRIQGRGELPSRLTLLAPTPLPVRDEAIVRFALPRSEADARLVLFGVDGRRVVELVQGAMPAGWNQIAWRPLDADGRRLASGVYLLRLSTSRGAVTTRILVVR